MALWGPCTACAPVQFLPEPAAACAPGIPEPSAVLDIVCIHAAACDLAIADVGFRNSYYESKLSVMASLMDVTYRAHKIQPKTPDVLGMLALMDFQLTRAMAADIQVRCSCGAAASWEQAWSAAALTVNMQ